MQYYVYVPITSFHHYKAELMQWGIAESVFNTWLLCQENWPHTIDFGIDHRLWILIEV